MRGLARGVWLAIALLVSVCGSQTSPERGVGSGGGGECEECECEGEGAGESDAGVAAGGGAGGGAGEGADADADDGVGSGECETGDSFCEGQVLYSCMDERWVTDDCRDNGAWGQTCFDPGNGAACGGECAEGRARCSGDNRELCDATGGFDLDRVCSVCVGEGRCADCVPNTETRCEDPATMNTCTSLGAWGTDTTDCAADGLTCYPDSCAGRCAYGTAHCVEGQNAFEECEYNGEYGDTTECEATSGTEWEVCRDGECVDSAIEFLGNKDVSGDEWGSTSLSADFWRIVPIYVPQDLLLFSLHTLLTSCDESSTQIRMTIWDERQRPGPGNTTIAQPGYYVAGTSIEMTGLGNHLDIPGALPVLEGGETYWVGVTVSKNCNIYRRQNDAAYAVGYPEDFLSTLEDPFPNYLPGTGSDLGIYLEGKYLF